MTFPPSDVWAAGEAYEPYVGRWSRVVAREFLGWLSIPPDSDWLDVGCGTGAPAEAILEVARPRWVIGLDASPGYVAFAQGRIKDARATFRVGDAQRIDRAGAGLDAAVSGLVLNFLPEPARAATEMDRVLKPGAVAAAYVWDYAGLMQMMWTFWDAAVDLDTSARRLDEGGRFPICRPGALHALWQGAGLGAVDTRAIDIQTQFRDFDDYW